MVTKDSEVCVSAVIVSVWLCVMGFIEMEKDNNSIIGHKICRGKKRKPFCKFLISLAVVALMESSLTMKTRACYQRPSNVSGLNA